MLVLVCAMWNVCVYRVHFMSSLAFFLLFRGWLHEWVYYFGREISSLNKVENLFDGNVSFLFLFILWTWSNVLIYTADLLASTLVICGWGKYLPAALHLWALNSWFSIKMIQIELYGNLAMRRNTVYWCVWWELMSGIVHLLTIRDRSRLQQNGERYKTVFLLYAMFILFILMNDLYIVLYGENRRYTYICGGWRTNNKIKRELLNKQTQTLGLL